MVEALIYFKLVTLEATIKLPNIPEVMYLNKHSDYVVVLVYKRLLSAPAYLTNSSVGAALLILMLLNCLGLFFIHLKLGLLTFPAPNDEK